MKEINTLLTRKIPITGEAIPALGMGTWSTFDVADDSDEKSELADVLRIFTDAGGKVIDSSPMYGRSEKVAGDLTHGHATHQLYFLATKVWTTGKQEGIEQINQSFKKMQATVIDLLQVHNLTDIDTQMQTLLDLKSEGRIRYTGITHYSTHAYPQLIQALKTYKPDFVQFNYNIKAREAERTLLPLAQDQGVAVIANRPFEEGHLFTSVKNKKLPGWVTEYGITSWAQYFLKFILSNPAITCVIPATGDSGHMQDIASAGSGKFPDEAMRKKMIDYFT